MAQVTMKQIWGLAKSPELSMTDEELHLLVERETGKTSMKELTARERGRMLHVLIKLKDPKTPKDKGRRERYDAYMRRGPADTEEQRKKIYMTALELGWDDEGIERSLRSMCRRMFSVADVSFLDYRQCSALIEALKSMKQRKERADGKES